MTAVQAVQAATSLIRRDAPTSLDAIRAALKTGNALAPRVAEILDWPPLVPLIDFGRAAGLADSTTYSLAAEGRLPVDAIQLGRKRFVRAVDAWAFFFGPTENGDGARGPALTPPAKTHTHTSANQ